MLKATSFRIMTKQKLINKDSSDACWFKFIHSSLCIQFARNFQNDFRPCDWKIKCGSLNESISKMSKDHQEWSRIKKQGVVNGCARVGINALYHKTYLCTLHFSSQRLFVRFLCVLFCSDFLRLGLSNP